VTETEAKEAETPPETPEGGDDARAAAAARNRKRAEKEWEENKKRWRQMGVPKGLPAKK
jgi:Raf kinase inhibitor-like YbhB/YbcL family protein